MPVFSTRGGMSSRGFGFAGLNFLQATGGTITSVDGYIYHTFSGSGQFVYQP